MSDEARGLLIVNADDFGADVPATDGIARCFELRAITSTTAMMWMADSSRAAAIARERELPVGLHVNLDTPYSAPEAPKGARADLEFVARRLPGPRGRWTYAPVGRLRARVTACIAAQREEFERLYGQAPTHIDGHHHVLELSPTAFLSPAVPRGAKVRNPAWSEAGHGRRLQRNWRRPLVRRRFVTTEYFLDLRALHPALGGDGLDVALELSRSASVELMVHPGFPDERAVLESPSWRYAAERLPLGSFRDL